MASTAPGTTDRIRLLLVGAVVVLTAAVVVLTVQNQQKSAKLEALLVNEAGFQQEIEDLETRMTQLDNDLQNKDIELEAKDKQVTQLSAQLAAAQQKLNRLSVAGSVSEESLDKYKYQIDQLNYYLRKYQAEIAELKRQNQELTERNEELEGEIETRDQNLRDLEQESRLVKTRLEAAAMLRAVEFAYVGTSNRGKTYPATANSLRGASTQKLQVCFKILENEVAETGNRPVYVTIKGPDGKILSSFETGSGFFTHNGQEVPYSSRVVVNYTRQAQSVCVDYQSPKEGFSVGKHVLTVYSGGFQIGESFFVIS